MTPPRFTVRHGSVLVHVAGEADLARVLQVLHNGAEASPVSVLAAASARLLEAAAKARPALRLRCLRDVMYYFRNDMSQADYKFLQQLNVAASLTQHVPPSNIEGQPRDIEGYFMASEAKQAGGVRESYSQASEGRSLHPRPDAERGGGCEPWARAAAGVHTKMPRDGNCYAEREAQGTQQEFELKGYVARLEGRLRAIEGAMEELSE